MKNVLKKLGVLGLIIAVVSPFINVNAETPECETHLQNYLFLDVAYPYEFEGYLDEGYSTYANFSYMFSSNENSQINNVKVTRDYLDTATKLNKYWGLYNSVYSYATMNSNNRYYNQYKGDEMYGTEFVTTANPNYTTNTILLHTQWARYDENGDAIISKWPGVYDVATVQEGLGDNVKAVENVLVDGATYNSTRFNDLSSSYKGKLPDYFTMLANKKYSEGMVWTSQNDLYVPLKITRKLSEKAFDDLIFGYIYDDKVMVFSKNSTTDQFADISKGDIEDSFEAYLAYYELSKDEQNDPENNEEAKYVKTLKNGKESDLNFKIDTAYYWPFVLNVEYDVCPLTDDGGDDGKDPQPISQWMVTYDDNVNDTSVTNMPSPSAKTNVGTPIKIDDKKPSRDNYTFKGWCETDNCSKPYQPGDEIKSPEASTTVKLLAQWAKVGPEENKKTGVMSYVLGFISVGVVAGGVYLISKKKNLFKQI